MGGVVPHWDDLRGAVGSAGRRVTSRNGDLRDRSSDTASHNPPAKLRKLPLNTAETRSVLHPK
jgi:hypothetical protein